MRNAELLPFFKAYNNYKSAAVILNLFQDLFYEFMVFGEQNEVNGS